MRNRMMLSLSDEAIVFPVPQISQTGIAFSKRTRLHKRQAPGFHSQRVSQRSNMSRLLFTFAFVLLFPTAEIPACLANQPESEVECDLLVVGGTESGWAAAIQAARMGVKRIVLVNDMTGSERNTPPKPSAHSTRKSPITSSGSASSPLTTSPPNPAASTKPPSKFRSSTEN